MAFGAHPDDVEVGCGGTLAAAVAAGKTVAIVDITRGELGTRGTAAIRDLESAAATKVLGVHARENLCLPDAFFQVNEQSIRMVITAIRKYRPKVILCNALECRHPDHARSARLVSEAAYLSGLVNIQTQDQGEQQQPWRPAHLFHYVQHLYIEPSFVVDISAHMDTKLNAILAYATQFNVASLAEQESHTFISDPSFMHTVTGRAALFGKRIGVAHAEGFISAKTLGIADFDAFV